MPIFAHKKSNESCPVAIFDIGSASVGGLLFDFDAERTPEILTSVRQPADFSQDASFSEIWRSFHKSFSQVSEHFVYFLLLGMFLKQKS
jgi:hypothetical protein